MRDPHEHPHNEIRAVVLGDGTVRFTTGEFSQANHGSADELMKALEAGFRRVGAPGKIRTTKLKHPTKQSVQTHHTS
jgi:hypothetical protein